MGFDQALEYGEARLQELAGKLDVPIDTIGERALVLGIARQAIELWQAARREATRGSVGAGMVIGRAVIERAILLRWIEDDPKLRVDMYHADDDRQRLVAVERLVESQRRREQPISTPFDPQEISAMKAGIEAARARALAAGIPLDKRKGRPVLPQIEQMAQSTRDTAIWEAYEVLYRSASPWTHAGGRSLIGQSFERRADGLHLVMGAAWDARAVRGLLAPTVAVLIASASRMCRLGLEGECKVIQDALATWETP